jgi:hypothetical protein
MADLASQQWDKFNTDIYPEMLRESKVQEDRANDQWATDKEIQQFQLDQSKKSYDRYEQGAIPAMEAIKKDADQYNEEGYREQLAQQAKADVDTQFENQRQQEAMRQRSYGVDPTSGVATGNMQSLSVQQALAGATAQNQVRQAAKDVGLQKQANVYNMYAGLPAQANANTSLGLSATNQGFSQAQSALGNFGSVGGSLNAATATSMSGWNNVGQLGVSKYNADVSAYNADQQRQGAFATGLGSAIGSGIALYKMSGPAAAASDINVKQNVKRIGVLGNGVPLYSFEYKPEYRDTWGHGPQIGVMAHEVEHIPGAVSKHADGYKLVDYTKVMNHGI